MTAVEIYRLRFGCRLTLGVVCVRRVPGVDCAFVNFVSLPEELGKPRCPPDQQWKNAGRHRV